MILTKMFIKCIEYGSEICRPMNATTSCNNRRSFLGNPTTYVYKLNFEGVGGHMIVNSGLNCFMN